MKHKWHDEIVAWAGGSEIEVQCGDGRWITSSPSWSDTLEYRIKPQPKEKKYLYVYRTNMHHTNKGIEFGVSFIPDNYLSSDMSFVGKIEVLDD